MNNFWNNGQQFQNNRANAYYPEALNINAQTQSFESPNTQGNFQQEQNTQNQNIGQNPFSNLFNTQNGGNLFGNLFGNNDLLTSLFASNLFGNNNNSDQKNNMLMQALSNMLSPQKKSKPSEENIEKVIDNSSTFEDL